MKLIEENEVIEENVKSSQVRKYLTNTLTPVISEGLLRMVEIRPKDPVDYLVASFLIQAEYLFQRSFEY